SEPTPIAAVPPPKTARKTATISERRAESRPPQAASPQPLSSATGGKPGGVAASGASDAGVGEATAKASYRDTLKSWLAAHKRYPDAARRQRIEGVAMLHFTVARDGRVLSQDITQSSGSEILDREVENMLARAEPLPAFPPELKAATLDVSLPIGFHITPSDF
ncbi:MAG TPA: energy transducer TonB, partial [Parvibaculum sp.]